jgi:hypothetical protein
VQHEKENGPNKSGLYLCNTRRSETMSNAIFQVPIPSNEPVLDYAPGTAERAFEYQGQKCSTASRAYIPDGLWPQVRDGLLAELSTIKMGDPRDFTNFSDRDRSNTYASLGKRVEGPRHGRDTARRGQGHGRQAAGRFFLLFPHRDHDYPERGADGFVEHHHPLAEQVKGR